MEELGKKLAVLQEDELRDIMNEYEQHIDMRIQSGLSEEEAIADFGSLGELAAEILEAYHVRTDYAPGDGTDRADRAAAKPGGAAGAGRKVLDGCRKGIGALWSWLKGAGLWIWGCVVWAVRQIGRPFRWCGRVLTQKRQDWRHRTKEEKNPPERKPSEGSAGRTFLAGAGAFVGRCLGAAFWCLRAVWNVCCAGFAGVVMLFGLFCIFALGTLTVLLIDGYPLAGVTLVCLGFTLCTFSIAGLVLTLIRRGKKEERSEQNV